jgi:hypothetical protein
MSLLQSLLGIALVAATVGCGRDPETSSVSGDVKTRIPIASEGGSYSLQEVTLQGITSLYNFGGQFGNFYIYPAVTDGKLSGTQPKSRFLKAGDLYVAEDELSQQMAVIYNHLQNMAALDEEIGAGGVNKWPRDVGMAVRYRSKKGLDSNNAFYDGALDAILVIPYTRDNLPIAVNAGILAHEHFHSLYYKLVEKDVFEKASKPLHGQQVREAVLGESIVGEGFNISKPETVDAYAESFHKQFSRGINEGLADYWAWMYTGDPDFLMRSLPSEEKARTLNLTPSQLENYKFPNKEDFSARMDLGRIEFFADGSKNPCYGDGVSYCLGTDYARTLKRFAAVVQAARGVSSFEARKIVAAAIVKTLPEFRVELLKYKQNQFFSPEQFFVMLQTSMAADVRAEEKAFLEELVAKSNENVKKKSKVPPPSLRPSDEDTGRVPTAKISPVPLPANPGNN